MSNQDSEAEKVITWTGRAVLALTYLRLLGLRGWLHVLLQFSGVIAVLLVVYVILGEPSGVDVPVGEKADNIVASTGIDGFPVADFCNDPLTKVDPFVAPDASGVTYQLLRVRNGVTETVIVVLDKDGSVVVGKHYFDAADGQHVEPAFLTDSARNCLKKKTE